MQLLPLDHWEILENQWWKNPEWGSGIWQFRDNGDPEWGSGKAANGLKRQNGKKINKYDNFLSKLEHHFFMIVWISIDKKKTTH